MREISNKNDVGEKTATTLHTWYVRSTVENLTAPDALCLDENIQTEDKYVKQK